MGADALVSRCGGKKRGYLWACWAEACFGLTDALSARRSPLSALGSLVP
jgi:hypothetical protein